jgi:hypothetical protein
MVGINSHCVIDPVTGAWRFPLYTQADVGKVVCSECGDRREITEFCFAEGTPVPTASLPSGPPAAIPWIPLPYRDPLPPGPIALKGTGPAPLAEAAASADAVTYASEQQCSNVCPTDSDFTAVAKPGYFPDALVEPFGVGATMLVPVRGWNSDSAVSMSYTEQRARYFGGQLYEFCDAPAASSAALKVASAAATSVPGEVVASRGQGSITADIDHDQSRVTIVSGIHVGTSRFRGTVTFETCESRNCPLTITSIRAFADDFGLRGKDIRGFTVLNHGQVVAVPGGDGTYSISALSRFDVQGYVDGDTTSLSTHPGSMAVAGYDGRRLAVAFAIETDDATVIVSILAVAHDVPPRARLSAPAIVECASAVGVGTTVGLDASESADADGDIAAYQWKVNGRIVAFGPEPTLSPSLALGTNGVSVTVFDRRGASTSASATVLVQDTTPPRITLATSDVCVWPPSHDMRLFTPEGIEMVVSDACDPFPSLTLLGVTNETDDGPGSGSTAPDEVFGTGAFCVRAERSGSVAEGRTYQARFSARDASCNESTTALRVHVPHDLGNTTCPPHGIVRGESVPDGAPACTASALPDVCAAAMPTALSDAPAATLERASKSAPAQGCSSAGASGLGALLALAALRRRKI